MRHPNTGTPGFEATSARSARAFERGDVDSVSLVNDGAQEVMKLLIPNANAAVPLVFQPVQ
jgi:hypothetical protein